MDSFETQWWCGFERGEGYKNAKYNWLHLHEKEHLIDAL